MVERDSKSDFDAKKAFVKELARRGFADIKIVKSPSDIVALKKEGNTILK